MVTYSPFPFFIDGQRHDGMLFGWPEKCLKCQHTSCRSPANDELSLCSYGFNFQKVADSFTVAGFLVKDSNTCSSARKKNLRTNKNWIVHNSHVSHTIEKLRAIYSTEEKEIADKKQEIITKYIEEQQYKIEFLDSMKLDINKGLSFVHDYKQINSQITQNINVIIESNYQGDSIEQKLELASHPERAIYWASKFLTGKLNVARFLLHPEWITRESEADNFRFHGLFIKYLRIYQYMFDKKHIHVSVSGESYQNVYGNPEAIGVIIHAFLDNALKYSRPRNSVSVYISDEENGVFFSVESYGPRIKLNETERIFQPFFRGEEAERMQEEGAGYGLYIAQMVAVNFGTRITMEQETAQKARAGHLTTFSVHIPYR